MRSASREGHCLVDWGRALKARPGLASLLVSLIGRAPRSFSFPFRFFFFFSFLLYRTF